MHHLVKFSMLCATLVLLTVFPGVARADNRLVANPEYMAWAKFKQGSVAKYRAEMLPNDGLPCKFEMSVTLKGVNPDAVIIEVKTSGAISGHKWDMPVWDKQFPARIRKPIFDKNLRDPETGNEIVTVGGMNCACEWSRTNSNQSAIKSLTTEWTCKDVPGGFVKFECRQTNPSGSIIFSSKMVLVGFEVK